MPVHDWTRVVAGNFHDFHQRWITHVVEALNGGLLPEEYYALAEQRAEHTEPDVLTLSRRDETWPTESPEQGGRGMLAVAEHPPRVEVVEPAEDVDVYAEKADRIAIRHVTGDRAVAFIEIVSPGNKNGEGKVRAFVEKLSDLFGRGCHLLVIDLIPPGAFDPRGLHAEFWGLTRGSSRGVTPAGPLGLSAYRSSFVPTAYFHTLKVGEPLPDMPLFLTPKHYVNVPLEATYAAAWRGVPQRWKEVLEAEPTSGHKPSEE